MSEGSSSELLLLKQYRPPIDQVVIEVPAGLIDRGETPEQCAVRELYEETGYVGQAEQTSPVMYNGKWGVTLLARWAWVDVLFVLVRSWHLQYQFAHGSCQGGYVASREQEPEAKA